MSSIYREEWTDELAEGLLTDFSEMQEFILLVIAERLESLSELSDDELEELAIHAAAAEYLNDDMARIKRAIAQNSRKFAPRIKQIFDEVETESYKQAKKYFDYRNIQLETVKKRSQTKQMIDAMRKQTVSDLLNLSHTYCYDYDGEVLPIGKAYRKIISKAVIDMETGAKTYDEVARDVIHKLSESGIKTLEWDSETGKRIVRRADSHFRMNVNEGVKRVNQELMNENGRLFGADGVETSMHSLCAPDHRDYQGKQFSLKEWEKINAHLKRPWGTLNCQHFATPIILGISEPVYTDAERQAAIDRSTEVVEWGSAKMSRYDASQKMRASERAIRKLRSEKKALTAAGAEDEARKVNTKLRTSIAVYKEKCNKAGLPPRMDRTKYYL